MESKQSEDGLNVRNYSAKPTVFIGGLPKSRHIKQVDDYIKTLSGNREYNVIVDARKKLRGFAFIMFDTIEEAQDFVKKEHWYQGKLLDCKLSLDHNDYIKSSLINIRMPKKVFLDYVPKKFTKEHLTNIFKSFGEVIELITIDKGVSDLCYTYVTFDDFESAEKVVKQGIIA